VSQSAALSPQPAHGRELLRPFLEGVQRTVLPNGLTLLTREDHRSGVVAINTWVKAGYFHEPDEVAGMAHLFEHMFFKGSKSFPGAEEIAQHVSLLGGSSNAGTIYDSTNYYFVLPREGFVRGVEIQADAIAYPLFDPAELAKEAEVVIEESNRKLDNPPAVATERMYATAFTHHRMRRWRIGSNEVLRNIRRDDLISFFQSLYRPENIIVSIVGDVTHGEALEVVGKTFGVLDRGELRKRGGHAEPPQQEFRFAESRADISQSYTVLGWHTPGEKHPDEAPLDVVATILSGGRYSRLFRTVVGPGAANTVSAANSVFEDVGMFLIRASMDDENLPEVERRIMREVERFKRYGPTEFELQLARNRTESGFVFELEDVLGQAQALAMFESRGSYLDMATYLDNLLSVTTERARNVTSRYLRLENLTLYRYRPPSAAESDREEVLQTLVAASQIESPQPEEIPIPTLPQPIRRAQAARTLQRFVLSNGITLFVKESPGTPTITTSLYFKGGRLHEHSRNAGITQLMARAVRTGTFVRSGTDIDREVEFLGTQLGISAEEDHFGFSLSVVATHFVPALDILADVILHPIFPEKGVGEEKQLQIASIHRSFDSSSERPFQLFLDAFYGEHPYALPESGYLGTVQQLDPKDLQLWHRLSVVADGALAVVVGDVSADDVHAQMEALFGGLSKSETLRGAIPEVHPPEIQREVIEVREKKQTALVVGFPTVPPQHPDWIPLRLLQDVTSGLAGTFFAELRGRRSLAYTVFAGDSSRELAGAFVGYIATECSKELEARQALLHEIARLGEDGISEDDLQRAKSYLAGSLKIRLQTNGALASEIAQNYLYGLGLDYTERFLDRVKSVTLDEIKAIAKKYLSRDNYTVAILRGKGG
jgi:zinc protease